MERTSRDNGHRQMRVLIDARSLGENATSNRTYWAELVAALGRRGDVEIVLATNEPFASSLVPPNGRIELAPSSGRWFSLVTLPQLARKVEADVVHVQYRASPAATLGGGFYKPSSVTVGSP